MSSRTYGKACGQVLWTPTRVLGTCSTTLPQQAQTQSSQGSREASPISHERQLSGVELAVATVAKWP